jgi:hypothetical protein
MRATATSASKPFLLPPLVDFVPLSTVPPNVNEGAGETISEDEELSTAAPPLTADASSSGSGIEIFSGTAMLAASRAGAAALAAPAEDAGKVACVDNGLSFLLDGTLEFGSEAAIGAMLGDVVCSSTVLTDSFDSPDAGTALEAEAAKLGCGTAFCAGALAAEIGFTMDAGRGTGPETKVGFGDDGAGLVGLEVEVDAAGFAPSFLRNKPRATRKVPFACSTLIGLVRTRFAPIRKAFATPACPSTTATARADWLFGELRALLKSNVAFCSLSQSTTTASKCSPINFFTAAKGSVQGTTSKSNSLRTCVTVRAVFSSGQKRSAR